MNDNAWWGVPAMGQTAGDGQVLALSPILMLDLGWADRLPMLKV